MNKKELKNKIEDLKQQFNQQLEEFKKEVDSTKPITRMQPILVQSYFYLDDFGNIDYSTWDAGSVDFFRYRTGNCFKTEQEAGDYKENILTKQALKDLALELNDGVEIDWNDIYSDKFFLYISKNVLSLGSTTLNNYLGTVYCLSEDFLTIAKYRIGEEKLIKLIKSGV